jgi:hypothetical protein
MFCHKSLSCRAEHTETAVKHGSSFPTSSTGNLTPPFSSSCLSEKAMDMLFHISHHPLYSCHYTWGGVREKIGYERTLGAKIY